MEDIINSDFTQCFSATDNHKICTCQISKVIIPFPCHVIFKCGPRWAHCYKLPATVQQVLHQWLTANTLQAHVLPTYVMQWN
jgi:hypothetical protein